MRKTKYTKILSGLALAALVVSVAPRAALAQKVDHSKHHAQPFVVSGQYLVPAIEASLEKDPMDGFNLSIRTQRFFLGPPPLDPSENPSRKAGKFIEGHAHIYLNDEKLARLYGRYVHLPMRLFSPGINRLRISLNTHQHQPLSIDGNMVEAVLLIAPSNPDFVLSHFSSAPLGEK